MQLTLLALKNNSQKLPKLYTLSKSRCYMEYNEGKVTLTDNSEQAIFFEEKNGGIVMHNMGKEKALRVDGRDVQTTELEVGQSFMLGDIVFEVIRFSY